MTAFIMRGLLAACLSLLIAGAPKVFGDEQSTSPYATAADFAKYAMKLREQALIKVEPQVLIPTSSRPAVQRYPWKMNIVTTVFIFHGYRWTAGRELVGIRTCGSTLINACSRSFIAYLAKSAAVA